MKRRFVYTDYVRFKYNIIYSSVYNTIAIRKDNTTYSWGYNLKGQVGDNTVVDKSVPTTLAGTKKTFCVVAVGIYTICALDKNGMAWSWGWGAYGELGINSIVDKSTPVAVYGSKTFCQIGIGYHMGGLTNQGRIWMWGYNNRGQLGDNSAVSKRTPVSIHGAHKTFCKLFIGESNTYAIDKYNRLWAWGHNLHGQIGDNTATSRRTPVLVGGSVKTFCSVTKKGYLHTTLLDKNGAIWACGYNNVGQIGDNSTVSRSTPIKVSGSNKTFCKLFAGAFSNYAIDINNQLWAWGQNQYGQLGDNSTTNRSTPVSIHGKKKTFCYVESNYHGVIAVDKNGVVWGWGGNTYGMIGDITYVQKSTPIIILI